MVIRFVDEMPMATGHGGPAVRYDWDGIVEALKKRPGKWALVLEGIPRAHAWQIRKGMKRQFRPPEHWLTRTTQVQGAEPHVGDLWLAYVGVPGARAKAEAAQKVAER